MNILENKKARYQTLGCKLNFAETNSLRDKMLQQGVALAGEGEVADICIVNTCSVTDMADHKCRQTIHRMLRENPGCLMVVLGCYAQLQPEAIASFEGVDLVIGMEHKGHTIEYIAQHKYAGNILSNDEDTKEIVGAICSATPTYQRNERQRVMNQNLRPVSHPYYGEYRPLQQLCLQILRQEEMKYGRDDDEIYGVLFDGAWLWEEYLNTFLADIGFEHPRNKEAKGRKSLFTDGSGWCYPDFLSPEMVLDAKYKWYDDWSKVQTKDLYQVISYMHVLDRENGGYIVPIDWTSPKLPSKKLNGKGGDMSIYGMDVCFNADSFEDYFSNMVRSEQKILNKLETYKG